MPDITKIKIGNERERSYKDFPANREFKKRAEDDNPGGGWSADLPKPSVGGYGYTEQGDETVIVDNESVTTVAAGGYIFGQFETPFNIVEGAYTVIFNGTEYNLNSAIGEEMFNCYLGNIDRTGPDFSQYPFVVADTGVGRMLFTESAGTYTVTVIKKSSDIIHKIDEKYLPASGGGWPSDLPKPSVGGYGYTESGEQTVITWDGDTDGKVVANETYYLVSDKVFSWDDLIGASYSMSSGEIAEFTEELVNEIRASYTSDNAIFVDYFACAIEDNATVSIDEATYTFPIKGVYFLKAGDIYVTSLTYGGDTIHKIDEKYLPEAGGKSFYINSLYNESTDNFDYRLVYSKDDIDTEFSDETIDRFVDWEHMKDLVGKTVIDQYGGIYLVAYAKGNPRNNGGFCVILDTFEDENMTALSSDYRGVS